MIPIREARRDDLPTLADFNAAMAWETERKRLDRAVLERGIAAVFDDPRRGFYLLAEHRGEAAGGLMVTSEWSDWRAGDWWWIQSVYVRPQARRQGVFRALYDEVERRGRAAGPAVVGLRLYVERDNQVAQRTYADLGMQEGEYRMFQLPFRALR